jgi:zinc transport system substrate-binding protein
VAVTALVGDGFNPETYEPTPRQVAELARARIYFAIRVPFERIWLPRIQAAQPEIRVVDTVAGIVSGAPTGGVSGAAQPAVGQPAPSPPTDPHPWTSPGNARQIARAMATALAAADPAHAQEFETRLAGLDARLAALDEEIRALLKRTRRKHLLVFHPSWDAFASAYGLTQIAIEQEGKEPGPRTLEELTRLAREHHIHTVFVQQQMSTRAAEALAKEIGGTTEVANPLAEDYLGNLRKVAAAFARALGPP